MTEIERKFLLAEEPSLDGTRAIWVEQGYLAVDGCGEVRIRRVGTGELWLTAKGGHGEVREEVEVALASADFDRLWPLTEGRRVAKTRHLIALDGGLCAELDVYEGALDGLRTVEVEFESEAASRGFDPPAWFGRELTGDRRYSNATMAVEGMPRSD